MVIGDSVWRSANPPLFEGWSDELRWRQTLDDDDMDDGPVMDCE